MTRVSFKGGIEQAILGLSTAVVFGGSLFISTALYAQETKQQEIKQLDSNEVIKEYGKIATGLALEERCLLLSPEATREYYWQQYMLDFSLNKVFTQSPVLNMIRGSAFQTSRNERFKCDQDSLKFINDSLQKARDLNKGLTGQTFEANVSDELFDQERLTIVSSAAGTNALCKHLLPEYDDQLRLGSKALTEAYQDRYPGKADNTPIDKAYEEANSQEKENCGDRTRQQALQGWQLTRMLMKQFRLAFATQ